MKIMRKRISGSVYQRGQVLLLVILVMVVSLTVGLSAVSNSITNLRNATEEENSQRALQAAEAGIQRVLSNNSSISSPVPFSTNGSQITSAVAAPLGGQAFLVDGGQAVPTSGEQVWLVNHAANGLPDYSSNWSGTMTIAWGTGTNDCGVNINSTPAMELIVFTDPGGVGASDAQTTTYVYDECHSSLRDNYLDPPGGSTTILGQLFHYRTSITVNHGLAMLVVPNWAPTLVGIKVTAGPDVPNQGTQITSVGSACNSVSADCNTQNRTQRKLSYFQGYDSLAPELRQYVYFQY
jgi:Tfp pilus assembly protein PilX